MNKLLQSILLEISRINGIKYIHIYLYYEKSEGSSFVKKGILHLLLETKREW